MTVLFYLRGLRREFPFEEIIPFGCGSLAVHLYNKLKIFRFYIFFVNDFLILFKNIVYILVNNRGIKL